MLIKALTYLPVFALMMVISTVLAFGAKKSEANFRFVLFSYAIALWTLFSFLTDMSTEQPLKLLFLRIALLFGTLATAVFPFFCAAYLERKLPRPLRSSIYLVTGIFVVFGFSAAMISGVSSTLGSQPSKYGILYQLQSIYTVISIIGGLTWMYIGTRHDPRTRNKVRLIMYGLLFAVAINFITGYILIQYGHEDRAGAIGPLSLLIFLGATFYSLKRYRTFDVRPYLGRIVLYLASIGLVVGATLFIVALSGRLTGQKYAMVIEYCSFAISLVVFPYVLSLLRKATQSVFFRDSYSSSQEINSILEIMLSETDITGLIQMVCKKISTVVGASYVRYERIAAKNRKTDVDGSENFSIRISKKIVGHIIVGPKKNGSHLTQQDREFIGVVAKNMSVVKENLYFTEKILDFNKTLKQEVEEATKSLKASNDELAATSQAKDEFMSMASHQIRPQLTAVRGFVEILQKTHIDHEQKDMLNWVSTGVERSIRIIADMLNLTRFTSGRLQINLNRTDFIELIHNEIRTLTPLATTGGIKLVDVTKLSRAYISVDELKMREVIANYCYNAIQYSPGSVRVEVKLVQKDSGWEFTVRDWGMGVSRKVRGSLFSKFYRAPDAIDARPSGTGIGLFLAKTVVEAHGGKVFYRKPNEGAGSIFGFWLPKK